MRTGGRNFLSSLELGPDFFQLLAACRGCESWEHNVLLVCDVFAADLDEFLQSLMLIRFARVAVSESLQ